MEVLILIIVNVANLLSVWFAAKNNRLTWSVGFIGVAITAVMFFMSRSEQKEADYEMAGVLYAAEKYTEAAEAYDALGEYKDSVTMADKARAILSERNSYDKAKKFLELAEEKKSLEISVWMRSLRRLKGQLAEQSSSIGVFQSEYDSLDADYNEAENRINALYEQIRDLDANVESKREKISENEAAIGELTAKAAGCQNDIEHNESEISRISEEISALSSDSAEGDSALEKRKAELSEKQAEAA